MSPVARFAALSIATVSLSGCFWGEVDGGARFTLSEGNVDQYLGLLYPTERQDVWAELMRNRSDVCRPDDEGCDSDERERSDLVDLFLRYDTTRVRGLLTQKGDLQITAHLDVGDAYKQLIDDSFDDWDYLTRTDRVWGVSGDGCDSENSATDRTGVGRCIFEEIEANPGLYRGLGEDIRLVILINLPGEDDVRSVECQDAPREFEGGDWEYPRTMLVNYSAAGPVEIDEGETRYVDPDDEEEPPLAQCEFEVYSQLNVATQVFGGDYYGQGEDNADLTIEEARDETDEPLVGSVVLEELVLPGEGTTVAKGRYHLAFTSQRFSEVDGRVVIEGSFDTAVGTDPVQVDDPEREIDLGPTEGDDL